VAPFIPDPGYTEDELLAFAAADMAEELVDAVAAGISVNCRDLAGHTPLILAAKYGARKAVLELLRLGADKDAANAKGATALYFAAKYGFIECVQDLLNAGADMELSPRMSRVTPYLVAVRHRNESVASALTAAGADISAHDARGRDANDYYRVEPTRRKRFAGNSGGVCCGGVV
jgi:ankyrin repeat protein